MSKKVKVIIYIFSLIALVVTANFAFAQNFGINAINETIILPQSSPWAIFGRVVQFVLSFLAIIALVLVIYAGFLWMTSDGDESKITSAKQILKNALIGLLIILSSWAITAFLLTRLYGVVGGTSSGGGGSNNLINPGAGAIGAGPIERVYPEDGQTGVSRNSSIIITFKEEVKSDSVCIDNLSQPCACDGALCNRINPEALRIYKTDLGDACAGTCPAVNANMTDVNVSISADEKTLFLTPLTYLGDQINNFWYSVKITDSLKRKSDNLSIFKGSSSNYFSWKFEVSTKLDLDPPNVLKGGVFPAADNERDIQNQVSVAVPAKGSITVADCPNIYQPSSIISVISEGASPSATATPLNYQGELKEFKVVVSGSVNRAQLFDANNVGNLLGIADFDAQNNVKFNGYFILKAENRNIGNSWEVNMEPEQLADTLTVGDEVYIFTSGPQGNNNIIVNPNNCIINNQATSIQNGLSGNQLIEISLNNNILELTAKTAGVSGNEIEMRTTNPSALQIEDFNGGLDGQILFEIKDKKDSPMNSIIQINFSESLNPLMVSGLASEVKDYIRVVNFDDASLIGGKTCAENADCLSYKCEGPANNKECVGDYINGRFLISNAYRTLEFISDNECGVNGCGEKIYCLPASSHLKVKLISANLKNCLTNNDCSAYSPFNICALTPLGYKVCQNNENKNYPTANSTLDGIVDAANNSFDGNRDIFSDGPLNFYDDNYNAQSNLDKKDNYLWSFYVNDKIMLAPPQIETVTPVQGAIDVFLADPLKISWNTLMMNSSLTTGSRLINNGSTTVEHKLINLRSLTPSAVGYWIANDNIDIVPLDDQPDKTISWIKHTPLLEAVSYRAQVGSGVKDIFQNCFKPSTGDGCAASQANPSCCFGSATTTLDENGNCQ